MDGQLAPGTAVSLVVERVRNEACRVTVSVSRISGGTGYRYLMLSVAVGDGDRRASNVLTRYYAQSGTPPGRWLGSGLAGLDRGGGLMPGSQVTEEQLFRLLGMACDPVSGQPLGRAQRRAEAAPQERTPSRAAASPRRRPQVAGATHDADGNDHARQNTPWVRRWRLRPDLFRPSPSRRSGRSRMARSSPAVRPTIRQQRRARIWNGTFHDAPRGRMASRRWGCAAPSGRV